MNALLIILRAFGVEMPEYRSRKSWNGMDVTVRDKNKCRRGLMSLRNYFILDQPEIEVDITNVVGDFPEIAFEQSIRQGTKMSPLKGFLDEGLEDGRRYTVKGREVKEQEDFRIDVLVSRKGEVSHRAVVFQATILSKDARRRDWALMIWGAVFGAVLGLLTALLAGFIEIVPFWSIGVP